MKTLSVILFCVVTCIHYSVEVPVDPFNSLVVGSTPPTDPFKIESSEQRISNTPVIYQMRVTSKIINRFAYTIVYSKVKNVAMKSQEAVFSVVIPETAFISGFVMEVDGKNYTAYVKEKEEAKRTYDAAVASGQNAACVTINARNSNRFTVSLNIEPETKAAFYLVYEELLQRQNGRYQLTINLHPGQPVKDLSVQVTISESRKLIDVKAPPLRSGNEITNENSELDPRATIKIVDDRNAMITFSPSLERQKQLSTTLDNKERNDLSGQFVVEYDVKRDPSGGEVLIKDGYFVHFFAPSKLKPIPKHVVFILDTSLSMYGEKIFQLREAMLKILDQLHEHDKFNLVEFNSNVKVWNLFDKEKTVWFPSRNDDDTLQISKDKEVVLDFSNITFPDAYEVNVDTIKKAKDAISTLMATASTDIYTALEVGLYLVELGKRKRSNHQPIIIFLTDGDPTIRITSTETIITKITEYNSGPRRSVVFTLSFGKYADRPFLKRLAGRNLGFSKHIYEAADASLQLQDFYKEISSPLLTNVSFKYQPSTISLTRTDFPVHFGGSEIVVAGFCGTPNLTPPTINGWSDHGWIRLKPRVVHSITSTERLWAYLTVKQLLDLKELSDKKEEELKRKALELSLKYEFVTSLSSLVVVKPNAVADDVQPETTDKSDFWTRDTNAAHHYSLAYSNDSGKPAVHKIETVSRDDTTTDLVKSPTSPSTTKEPPKLDIFTSIPWLKEAVKDGVLNLDEGMFKLGLNESISDDNACVKAPLDEPVRCTLLNDCKHMFFLLTSKNVLQQYFCILRNEYAGVCCPDLP